MSTTTTTPPSADQRAAKLHRLACALVVAVFFLLVAGGQVTSTESGDAVDQWPLPLHVPSILGTAFWELFHRAVAGAVALLTATVWIALLREGRRADSKVDGLAKKLALAAVVLVLLQAGMGGVRVLVGAADPNKSTPAESGTIRAIAIAHAGIAQAFLLLTVTLAHRLGPHRRRESLADAGVHRLAVIATGACYLQVVLGAIFRHTMTGASLAIHIAGAALVLVLTAVLCSRVLGRSHDEAQTRPAAMLGIVLLVQTALGVLSWWIVHSGRSVLRGPEVTAHALVPTFHLVVGGLLLALTWVLALRTPSSITATNRASVLLPRPAGSQSE